MATRGAEFGLLRTSAILCASMVVALGSFPAFAQERPWRGATAHAKANAVALVLVRENEKGAPTGKESAYCAGTVIREATVLTAWHCVDSEARLSLTWAKFADGRKYRVKGVQDKAPGWDLALLDVPGASTSGEVVLSEDIEEGDELLFVGNPDGSEQQKSWGRVGKKYVGLHEFCDQDDSPAGFKPHQILVVDRLTFVGYSGGGGWDEQGRLVAVHVRGWVWEPYPDYFCKGEPYRGEFVLMGAAVGPQTIRAFLDGKQP